MNKLTVLILTNIIIQGCASTTWNEEMMADGITWKVTVSPGGFPAPCKMTNTPEECINVAKPLIKKKSLVICNKEPERIFGCGKTILAGFYAVSCNVRCNKHIERKLLNTSRSDEPAEPPLTKKEKIKKAKKCQSKGGVYIDGRCEIDLD